MLLCVEVLNVVTLFVCFCSKCKSAMESFPERNMIRRFKCFFYSTIPMKKNIYDSAVFRIFSLRLRKKFEYEVRLQLFAEWEIVSAYLFIFFTTKCILFSKKLSIRTLPIS